MTDVPSPAGDNKGSVLSPTSSGSITAETVNGSHQFVIQGYSLAKGMGNEKHIASENFTVGGYQWAIYFHPDGKNLEDNATYVSIFIALASEGTDVRALCELTLIDQSGKGKHKVHSHFDQSLEIQPYTFEYRGSMWGYNRFMSRAMLENSDYLKDDCIKITCTVGVVAAGNLPDPGTAGDNKISVLSPTSSRSMTETVNGSQQLVIQGYSLSKGIGIGKYIASENFTVGGYQWAIYFYPDGKYPEGNSTYVSAFIVLASEGTDVRALFELTLIDQSGKGKHRVHSHFDRSLGSGPSALKHPGSMWGYKQYLRREMLETSDYLKDDCIKITCTVGVVVSSIDSTRLHTIHVPDSDIGANFSMLLENMEGSDVVFDVCGEKFHAHRSVLAARSPVLMSDDSDDKEVVVVTDMDPNVFKVMLNFIYRDSLVEEELVASSSSVDESLMAKLLAAADRYDLGRLKSDILKKELEYSLTRQLHII